MILTGKPQCGIAFISYKERYTLIILNPKLRHYLHGMSNNLALQIKLSQLLDPNQE